MKYPGHPKYDNSHSAKKEQFTSLDCGCVLYGRMKMMTGPKNIMPATNGRVYNLDAGDRIEMQFWLLVSRSKDPKNPSSGIVLDTCQIGGTNEHTVRLDDTSDEVEPKQLFASVPWIKFTLVAVKPDSDVGVDHVPLSPHQLPGTLQARGLAPRNTVTQWKGATTKQKCSVTKVPCSTL